MKGHLEQCNVKSFNSISKHTNLPNRKKKNSKSMSEQEEIQCRQSNKRFRCVPNKLEEGRRCRWIHFLFWLFALCFLLHTQQAWWGGASAIVMIWWSSFSFQWVHAMCLPRCKEHTRFYEGECVHAPGHNIVSTKVAGTGTHGAQNSMGFDEVCYVRLLRFWKLMIFRQDGGAGILEALSTLLGPIGFFTIILLCVGVCIVYHNAKWDQPSMLINWL